MNPNELPRNSFNLPPGVSIKDIDPDCQDEEIEVEELESEDTNPPYYPDDPV